MKRLAYLVVLAACGGGHGRSTMPTPRVPTKTIGLESFVAHQAWYRSPAACGQGPYDIVIPATELKWGEQVELMLHTSHGVALRGVLLVDGVEVEHINGVFDGAGAGAHLDNTRCLADKRERVAAGRASSGGSGTTTGGTPVAVGIQVSGTPTTTAQLDLDTEPVVGSTSLLTFRLKEPAHSIVLRLWSVEPNDLDGVRIGALKLAWRPNVPEAEYEAYLVRLDVEARERAAREAAERERAAAAAQLRAEEQREWLRKREEKLRAQREADLRARYACRSEAQRRARGEQVAPGTDAHERLCRQIADEDEANRKRMLEEQEEARRHARENEEAARRRALAEAEEARRRAREAEEEARAEQLRLQIAAEQKRKREQFCASHPDDRGCWGAGGRKVHDELEAAARERDQFCAAHHEDVRCWTDTEWQRHRTAWNKRVEVASTQQAQPEGPPPAPLAEDVPPKLSVHAEWRPGYWLWLDAKWVWLAGMWRVPEADIVAEQTTTAPAAPPPLRVETPPPPPVVSAVWVTGFWQWNGTSWVWIAGSYQLRPSAQVSWRAPEWRARGSMHVLIPGGWIRIGGSR